MEPNIRRPSVHSLGADMQFVTAVLAMHGIDVMACETATRTLVFHFARSKNCLHETNEQCDTDDHDNDGKQSAFAADKNHIAEPGRRQRSHRKVKRVDVVVDRGVYLLLPDEDEGRNDKNENKQIDGAETRTRSAARSRSKAWRTPSSV
jgi:hypothetical protein